MKQINNLILWPLILLSALLFNSAFILPDPMGILIILVPVLMTVWLTLKPSLQHGLVGGFVWGVCVYGFHFHWLVILLKNHSGFDWWMIIMIYCFLVIYFSLTAAALFWAMAAMHTLVQPGSFIIVCAVNVLYWGMVSNHALKPLGLGVGYPFINPLIPLASSAWCMKLVMLLSFFLHEGTIIKTEKIQKCTVNVSYIEPVINRVVNVHAPWRTSSDAVANKLYQRIRKKSRGNGGLFAAPESTFPFPLNTNGIALSLIHSALSDDKQTLLLGSILEHNKAVYQAVFCLPSSPIIKFYVKKILTPFVEYMPPLWRLCTPLKQGFLMHAQDFHSAESLASVDGLSLWFDDDQQRLRIIPQICLEFFFLSSNEAKGRCHEYYDNVIFLFANDSWFNVFFRKILHHSAVIQAHKLALPVIYIGHFGYEKIDPFRW